MHSTDTAALITGATDGIGRALAHQLAGRVATLLLHGRDSARLDTLCADLGASTSTIVAVPADFSDLLQVRRLATEVTAVTERLHLLVNNAGVAGIRSRQLTDDGNELTLQVNYLAPVLLTELLLPSLKAPKDARIINVASMLHRSAEPQFNDLQLQCGYTAARAYALSKLALVSYTTALAQRLAPTGCRAVSLHPGVIDTKILRRTFGGGGMPTQIGAANIVHLAFTAELTNGAYYHEQHPAASHPAATNPTHQRQLNEATWPLLATHLAPLPRHQQPKTEGR